MSDNKFDKEFDELFAKQAPKPDENRKSANLKQSKSEFSQAFSNSNRLNKEGEHQAGDSIFKFLWRFVMSPIKNPFPYQAFATVAIGIFALSLVLYLPRPSDEETLVSEANNMPRVSDEAHLAEKFDKAGAKEVSQTELEQNVDVGSVAGATIEEIIPTATRSVNKDAYSEKLVADSPLPSQPKKAESREYKTQRSLGDDGAVQNAPLAASAPQIARRTLPVPSRSLPTEDSELAPQAAFRPDTAEEYAQYTAQKITQTSDQPVSTFSVDVDTAAYSLVRNQLNQGYLPKPQAVRAEELINYFDYDYDIPKNKTRPFKPSISVLDSPWNEGRKLVHIGIKGYDIAPTEQPDTNLVFLLDVSGSMNQTNKLPLVKQSLALLLDSMKPTDTVSIAVYAGAAGVVLDPTPAAEKTKILQSLQNLSAGGSTAGGQGIRLAYQLAEQNFNKEAVNRIILATDGDFNVGQSSNEDLKTLVERKRDQGVFLSVLGFGRNNYQDDMMQTLAQNGNGVAAYIDTLSEAKKVLVDEASSTLFPIAKDVKIQVEFNPAQVSDYRLVGYETRALNQEDFNNDKVDAGDIGAGHTVTAIYEVTLAENVGRTIDPLRYEEPTKADIKPSSSELGFLKIRYKLPKETKSRLIEAPITFNLNQAGDEAKFSVAVAGFAQLMANSKHTGRLDLDAVIEQANSSKGKDEYGYRTEFIQLVRMAKIAQP